jgi:putative hydrolase of the HAD superfamily
MTTPRVVVFDLGKVLVDFDYSIAARRIAAKSSLGAPAVQTLIETSPLLIRFETGRINSREFFNEVREGAGFGGTIEEFTEFFADIFTPIEPMVRLHSALRDKRKPTFIFSNTNTLAVEHIRSRFGFFRQFDGYVFSYEEGAMKPEAAIYESVERRTGHRGSEILYIDDRSENVAAGAERGWRVILQETPERTENQVRSLGLLG